MKALYGYNAFEWDEGNLNKNFISHSVSRQESENAFVQEPQYVYRDIKHSSGHEDRKLLLGKTAQGRKLSIVFTLRENKIRVISARDMSKKERRIYEEAIKTDPEL